MSEIDLQDKFPDLQPINKPPSLGTLNGCGLSIYGARDKDAETGTYIKTHLLTLLYIPIIALGAYRVMAAESGGWYFIGREPLSAIAKAWNALLVIGLAGGISFAVWNAQHNSPNAIADRKITAANKLLDDGKVVQAAKSFESVAYGSSDRSDSARASLVTLHDLPSVQAAPLSDIATVLQVELSARRSSAGDPVGKAVFDVGMNIIDQRGANDLAGANLIFQAIEPVVADEERYQATRQSILEQLVQSEPQNVSYASDLAEALEAQGDLERCEELLTPLTDKLADTEGARILGQIWAAKDLIDQAHGLLVPYCDSRLAALNQAEAEYVSTVENEQQRVLTVLNNGSGPQSFYTRYENADEATQTQMVQTYVSAQLQDNRSIEQARQAYMRLTNIVPVALDLGMVRLRRAQAMQDPQQRRDELQAAEKTFVSIRSVAGESDEYRLYMGQVNYWLGKYDAGRDLFESLLDSNGREHNILLAVARMVREVGRSPEARNLVEEAYENARDNTEKQSAAATRAAMSEDNDDRIEWLGRADTSNPEIKAGLESAKGTKAFIAGEMIEAEKLYRQSIASHDEAPEAVGMLNNSGLTCFSLYRITGKQADFNEGLRRIEKAISLLPADSILRYNLSHILISAAYGDIIGDAIDLRVLKNDPTREMLGHLYIDDQQRQSIADQLRDHQGAQKAISMLENVVLLAPKNPDGYGSLATVYRFLGDTTALRELRDRAVAAEPEVDIAEKLQFATGEVDPKHLEALASTLARTESSLKDAADGSLTQAVLVDNLISIHAALSMLGQTTDLDPLVDQAQRAYAATPSSSSRHAVINALAYRAHHRLMEQNEAYLDLAERTKRTAYPATTLGIASAQGGPLGKAVHRDADVMAMMKLIRDSVNAFPDNPSSWDWAMFRHVDEKMAATIATRLQADELTQLFNEIGSVTSPASIDHAVQVYWSHQSARRQRDANIVMQNCEQLGMPLPFELP